MATIDGDITEEEYNRITHNMEMHRRMVELNPHITHNERSIRRRQVYMYLIWIVIFGGQAGWFLTHI